MKIMMMKMMRDYYVVVVVVVVVVVFVDICMDVSVSLYVQQHNVLLHLPFIPVCLSIIYLLPSIP
ncbi:hypothetical protein JOL62DRAFT_566830 [Phyllosticta paracitricarpa]|uniref:Uncharacterized protein n=1 Tax=Phyllosticta paracitricarpa TaxID=2016321 RepID=A0ABR1NFN2_9PEZI